MQYSNTYFLLGTPAPVTINSVVASASPFTYPYTAADVKGTSTTNGINYKVYSFTSVSSTTSYTVNYSCNSATTIYVLAVGGGGGGAVGVGGGGCGGGVVMLPINLPSGSSSIVINVGNYGPGNASGVGLPGSNTTVTFNANTSANIIAYGGYGGLQPAVMALGTAPNNNNFNYSNYAGGFTSASAGGNGGGGAGTPGMPGTYPSNIAAGGAGGNGIQCFLPGISTFTPSGTSYGTYYWGGGGGGVSNNGNTGIGGLGGGGGASCYNGTFTLSGGAGLNNGGTGLGSNGAPGAGGANTGGGGGGLWNGGTSANGGSGIVIIAFPSDTPVTSNQSAVLPASIVSSGLYSATLNNINLSSLAYNTIKGAYACRLLNYNYFGPIMTLRYSTDICGNYTQNFYSDICGNLGTGYMGTGQSVSTWLSGNAANTTYAYVTKWYNQGMDVSFSCATQYTTTFQPIYDVSNGVINYGYTGGTGVSALNIGYLNLPTNSFPINDSSFTVITKYYNNAYGNNNSQQFLLSLNNSFNYLAINNNIYPGFNFGTAYGTSVGLLPLLPSTSTSLTYKYTSWTTSGTLAPNIQIYQNGTASTGTAPNSASTVVNSTSAHTYTQANVTIGNNPSSAYACSSAGILGTATNYYLQSQLNHLYVFSSALTDADRLLVEATPSLYSVLPAITGLSATQVTSTTFVLGWSTVSNAQTYALWINGSYFATYSAPALTTGTVTPTMSGPWILNLYAYNASNVLLATGSTGAAVLAGAILTANSGATQTPNGTNTVFTFTSSGTFTAATTGYASVLIVGGGGGGGNNYGGGGGAGGLVYFDTNYKPMLLTAGTSYTVTVGTGGGGGAGTGGRGANGLDSTFNGYIAKGGGGGSYNNGGNAAVTGVDGGCGGGSNNIATPGGSTQPTYANAFYVGGFSGGVGSSVNMVTGGGGGAGGLGGAPTSSATVSGVGGPGYSCNIIGTPTYYGGGGGGGAYQYTGGSGGVGGGGNGGSSVAGSVGAANTGGGGGGSSTGSINSGAGYNGGSGVVIISCQGLTTIAGLATSSVTATNFVLSWTTVANISYILFINGTKYGTVTTGSTVTPSISGPWPLELYGYNASNVFSYYGTISVAGFRTTALKVTSWYNPDNITMVGGCITTYPDAIGNYSMNTLTGTAATTFAVTTGTFNSATVKYINNNGSGLGVYSTNNTYYSLNNYPKWFIFCYYTSTGGLGYLINEASAYNTNIAGGGGDYTYRFTNGTNTWSNPDIQYQNIAYYINGTAGTANVSPSTASWNIVSLNVGNPNTMAGAATYYFAQMGLFANQRFGSARAYSGYMGDLFVSTSSSFTDNSRQAIEGYLAWKYGIQGSLPAGHPYKSTAPGPIVVG